MDRIKIEKDIKNILIPNEEVLYFAQQSRVRKGGSLTTPAKLYITNYRILFRDPSFLGLKKFVNDYHFKDISNVRMKKGVLSTEVFLNSRFESDEVIISGLPHEDAEMVVRLIQNGVYGNFNLDKSFDSTARLEFKKEIEDSNCLKNKDEITTEEIISNLERLNELRKSGVITEDEFDVLKKRMIHKHSDEIVSTDIQNEPNYQEESRYCKDCGDVLDFTKEGEYRGDYVKFYKCNFCNKTYAKKI